MPFINGEVDTGESEAEEHPWLHLKPAWATCNPISKTNVLDNKRGHIMKNLLLLYHENNMMSPKKDLTPYLEEVISQLLLCVLPALNIYFCRPSEQTL